MSELEALRAELGALRARVDEADDWANGIQMAFVQLLPLLLRGHPEVEKAHRLLQASDDRYEELHQHPARAESPDEKPGLYEPSKMLNRQLALLGVWPGVAAQDAVNASSSRSPVLRRPRQ